jgi:hypothetical protein
VRFELWLGQKRAVARAPMTDGTVRVSRLAPALATVRGGAGWLIEFEPPLDGSPIDRQCIAAVITDLRLLGLEATVLTPGAVSSRPGRPRVELTTEAP